MNEVQVRSSDAPVFANLESQMGAINVLGEAITRSGFAGCEKIEQGVIIAFTCLAERITPIEFSRTYDIIQGRPTKKAAVMLAEFRSQYGGDFDWIEDGEDGNKATIQLTYKGKEKNPVSFTIAEASKKGLASKPNWKMHLPEMLRARCITKALRMHVPEIAAGLYDPYEIDANVAVQRLMGDQNLEVRTEEVEYRKRLDSYLSQLTPETMEKAIAVIKAKLSVAEIDSLNEAQAQKLVENWESFMELPEMCD
jgi:hypothetical protein